jgi:hypothetical protein
MTDHNSKRELQELALRFALAIGGVATFAVLVFAACLK